MFYEAGVIIPDNVCDATNVGQEIVRTLAHEIAHYPLNHTDGEADHVHNDSELRVACRLFFVIRTCKPTYCLLSGPHKWMGTQLTEAL